ncbi:hypothetical protein QFC19_000087 [Naganishia cerealis]|uniref:Uncharacterized protein n=1 Tax=Naganishia cerealis TaxID=610337 RepID=A0ACC2WQZ9_9TREE|nr:hypothetical protein QFC19_000087 [Naganishia cerealis]
MMPGAYVGSDDDDDGETDAASRGANIGSGWEDDLESGGASVSAASDLESASPESSSEAEVVPSTSTGTSVSGTGGMESDVDGEEQGTVPLLPSSTVPPPRSRPPPPAEHSSTGSCSRVVDWRGTPVYLEVICTPAQHRSGRGLMDQMSTLWASWVVRVVGEGDEGHGDGDGIGAEEGISGAPTSSQTAVGSAGEVTGPSEEVWAKKGWNVFFGGSVSIPVRPSCPPRASRGRKS